MNDRTVVILVIGFLGATVLGCIAVLAVLLLHDKVVDSDVKLLFSSLATGAMGAIAGLLAHTSTSPPNPPAPPANPEA